MNYESTRTIESNVAPGVQFEIRRMSFGRRLEFTKLVRQLGQKLEFLEAGVTPTEKLEAALVTAEINRVYLGWGLAGVTGLTIDGMPADAVTVTSDGPEDLCREILAAIKHECGLTDEERKKLIVAFQFQCSNQAAWKCDECRKSGLEIKRNCGWLPVRESHEALVWARGSVAITTCPKSYVSADSLMFIDAYQGMRRFGMADLHSLPARTVDAFIVLEREMRTELTNVQKQS